MKNWLSGVLAKLPKLWEWLVGVLPALSAFENYTTKAARLKLQAEKSEAVLKKLQDKAKVEKEISGYQQRIASAKREAKWLQR